jgi:hypothetical protein
MKNVCASFLTISDVKQFICFIIGIICGPVLFIWTLVRGDLTMTINFPHLLSLGFIVCLLELLSFYLVVANICSFLKKDFCCPWVIN